MRVVCALPTAVGACPLDRRHPARPHRSALDQCLGALAVYLRPDALWLARSELLHERLCVAGPLQAVDPAMAEAGHHCLVVADRFQPRSLLRDPEPDAGRGRMVLLQPSIPFLLAREKYEGE